MRVRFLRRLLSPLLRFQIPLPAFRVSPDFWVGWLIGKETKLVKSQRDRVKMSEENRGNNFLGGLILGSVIGAGLYYFLTSTEEGKRIKTRIKEKSEEALDSLDDLIAEIENKGEDFKQKAKQIQAQLEEKAASIQGQATSEAKEQLAHINQLRERGREAVNFFTRNGKPLS